MRCGGPTLFWTGRLTLPVRLMVNASNALAWLNGTAGDTGVMTEHVRLGYEGVCSGDVLRYDELGMAHYTQAGEALLAGCDLVGRRVLDLGCGTGIVSAMIVERGASAVVGLDLAHHMLAVCRQRIGRKGGVALLQGNALRLPLTDACFDAVVSAMVLGMVPDQPAVLAEMVRVLRVDGLLALSTHGPEHYWEANDSAFRAVPPRYVLGYRVELWPRSERTIARWLAAAGLRDVRVERLRWRTRFPDGGAMYDFFASTSGSWWFSTFPAERVIEVSQAMRRAFVRRRRDTLTSDIVLAYGHKL